MKGKLNKATPYIFGAIAGEDKKDMETFSGVGRRKGGGSGRRGHLGKLERKASDEERLREGKAGPKRRGRGIEARSGERKARSVMRGYKKERSPKAGLERPGNY